MLRHIVFSGRLDVGLLPTQAYWASAGAAARFYCPAYSRRPLSGLAKSHLP